ncbi:hypothetical protein [Streptomyces mobaraensis]|uniref:Uncharacterized protein n=1 Tax=Streptomyces mobaraensis TaxID=35621 RepID=A0A5N5WEI2_STRMB|nr:hypothetical protein [Streptomyces mobaraensis]KAB7850189.1 hypothetical protein FRZ00_06215 [Streptomyces mobaraensis]
MTATVLLAVVALAGLTAAVWAVDLRLARITARWRRARLRPAPPYAGFDMTVVYRVLWDDCPSCERLHAPHEADDETEIVRCVGCGHRRPATEEAAR